MQRLPVVVGIGEVLWDVFPDAAHFGGAPANFACHSAALGAEAWIVSAVGCDELGERARETLRRKGVHVGFLQTEEWHGTGSVHVTLDARGQATYAFAPDPAWDHLSWSPGLEALARRCDAVCFGTLAQRSATAADTIHRFLNATAPAAWRVFDVNLRQNFYCREILLRSLATANVLKLNDEELPVLQELLDLGGGSQEMLLRALGDRFGLKGIAFTRGAHGSLLWWRGEFHEEFPAPVEVLDTVGAGDSFTAALILGLLRDESVEVIHRRASGIASYVCSQRGATPELPVRLMRG